MYTCNHNTQETEGRRIWESEASLGYTESTRPASRYTTRPCLKNKTKISVLKVVKSVIVTLWCLHGICYINKTQAHGLSPSEVFCQESTVEATVIGELRPPGIPLSK